jgi:hypothetical protein
MEANMHDRTFWVAVGAVIAVSGAAAVAAPAVAASRAAPKSGALVIRHQLRGCHAWSYDNGPFRAGQSITLARGASLKITDADVMSHTLVETSGPAVRMSPGAMGNMGMMDRKGAVMQVTFAKAGTYHFRTHAGEDYMSGVKTVGPDNVLKLTVVIR